MEPGVQGFINIGDEMLLAILITIFFSNEHFTTNIYKTLDAGFKFQTGFKTRYHLTER